MAIAPTHVPDLMGYLSTRVVLGESADEDMDRDIMFIAGKVDDRHLDRLR